MTTKIDDDVNIRRRVSTRRRSSTESRYRDFVGDFTVGKTSNGKPKKQDAESIDQWIDNSFLPDASQRKAAPTRKARGGKARGRGRKSSGGGRKNEENEEVDLHKSVVVVETDEGTENSIIFCSLTSTPVKVADTQPVTQMTQTLMPSTMDPDAYCSQHDSFNEDDHLFGDHSLNNSHIQQDHSSNSNPIADDQTPRDGKKRKAKNTPNQTPQQQSERRRKGHADIKALTFDKTGVFYDDNSIVLTQKNNGAVFDSNENLFNSIDLGVDKLPADEDPNVQPVLTKDSLSNSNLVTELSSKSNVQLNSDDRNTKFTNQISVGSTLPPVQSFRERLKSRLVQNAQVVTPTPAARQQSRVRQEMVDEAIREVTELKKRLGHDHAPGETNDPGYEGDFYGLSDKVKVMFEKHRGIKKLYAWQDQCLSLPSVEARKNLIYSLPTSGGKTLVAEILILKELLLRRRDAMFILPFVSIVQEKVRGLTPFAVDLEFVVEEYAASKGAFPPRRRRNKRAIYVCTLEKANSLVNSLVEAKRLDELGLVVVDELHMLGEGGSRGAVLEMSLTKILHATTDTQIIGMSATLNNIEDLQTFLKAEVYSDDFRPVKLCEYVKLEDTVYAVDGQALCPADRLKHHRTLLFPYTPAQRQKDQDRIAALVQEVVPDKSCLVFCPTKRNCENIAELVCQMMPRSSLTIKAPARCALLSALQFDGGGHVCPTLRRTIPHGVAYHHSGLTADERRLVEEAYSEGTLCMLACTSTLAAGVNLPAKRVILRSPYVGASFLSRSQYKQMIGRAGRAGIDTEGESILVLQRKDKTKLLDLVGGPFESCLSSLLYEDKKGIRSLLLTTITLEMTDTTSSVLQFLRQTLCYVQRDHFGIDLCSLAREALQNLLDLRLIRQQRSRSLDSSQGGMNDSQILKDTQTDGRIWILEATKLGKAVVKGSIDLSRGPRLYQDLRQAQSSLVVANHLHLLYLVTPYDMADTVRPDWNVYMDEMCSFGEAEMKVASLIGVPESYIAKRIAAQRIHKPVDESVVRRFYLTLMLYNLWRQRSIWDVAQKFSQPRGFVQQLLTGAAAFAACVSHFCQELEEFWAYQDLLANFVRRLSYCVTMEFIELMEIPGVKIGRARQLFCAGYKTLSAVAYADADKMVSEIEHLPKRAAKLIVSAAQMLLQERAESLVEEAGELMAMPAEAEETPQTEKSEVVDNPVI